MTTSAMVKWVAKATFTGSLLCVGTSMADEGAGVTPIFLDDGGVIYRVNREGFEQLRAYGGVGSDGYDLPVSWSLRSGCFVATPWVPVTQRSGKTMVYPNLRVEWRGEFRPQQDPYAEVLNMRVEVRKSNGAVQQTRTYMTTGLLNLERRATYPDGSTSYYGWMDSPGDSNFGNYQSVEEGDRVRFLVCDAWPGVGLTLRGVDIHSIGLSGGGAP